MKYQCLVCGQIIDQNDVCPICGSDSSKIVELGDNIETTTYRCLSCGRIFENKDVCPFCGGEELYDLTHDKMFNRNDKKEEAPKPKIEEEPMNLFSDFNNEEEFEDKPVSMDNQTFYPKEEEKEVKTEEVKEEADPTLITDDEFENSDIIVSDDYNVETNSNDNVEAKEEDSHVEEEPNDDSHVSEENIDVDLYNEENHEDASSLEEALHFDESEETKEEPEIKENNEKVEEIKHEEPPKVAHYEEFAEFSDATEEEEVTPSKPTQVKVEEKVAAKEEKVLDSREDLVNSISLKALNLMRNDVDNETKLFLLSLLNDLSEGNEEETTIDDVFDGINHLLTLDNLEFSKNPTPENGYLLVKHKKILDNLVKKMNKGK